METKGNENVTKNKGKNKKLKREETKGMETKGNGNMMEKKTDKNKK